MTEYEKLITAEQIAHTVEITECLTGKTGMANTCAGRVALFYGAEDGNDDKDCYAQDIQQTVQNYSGHIGIRQPTIPRKSSENASQLETRFKAPYWQICWYGACFLFFCKIDKFFRILNGVYFATRWLIQIADTHAAVICQVSIALEHTISCIFLGCIDNFVCLSLSQ